MNPSSLTPIKAIILGAVGFCMVSFLAYHWLTAPILTDSDLTQFSGKVSEIQERSGNSGYLEISLSNQPYPFRCFSFPTGFDKTSLQFLRQGTAVSIGIASSEVDSPRRHLIQNQIYYKMLALNIAGHDALSIDTHNRTVESDRRFGPWFCLIMAVLSVFLMILGFSHHRSGKPIFKMAENESGA